MAKEGKINPIQLQKHLKGVDYPAKKEDLVKKAQENGADDNVVATLEKLSGKSFQTPAEVNEALGKLD